MQEIPTNPVPSQTLQGVFGGQNCVISIYTRDGYSMDDVTLGTPSKILLFDLTVNGVVITTAALCLNVKRLLINRQYMGVIGDFMFVDTQGDNDPQYAGLGSRYQLLYVEQSDLEAFGLGG